MKLLTVGSVGFDTIKTPFGSVKSTLGGSATHFCLAARYFTVPCLISAVGTDFTGIHSKKLLARKIDLSGLEKVKGKTMAWGAEYGYDLNTRNVTFTHLNVLDTYEPKVPKKLQNTEMVFLSAVSSTQQKQVLGQMKRAKFIAWDTISYYIHNDRKGLMKNLGDVDCCFINDTEARQLTKEHNLLKAAKGIMGMMGKKGTLIIKQGEHGCLMFQGSKIFHLPGYPLEDVIDPTGAGDSFAGGFLGYLAKTNDFSWPNLKKACVAGSVMASFCCEQLGTKGLLNLSSNKIKHRIKEFKTLTHFEG